MTIVFLNSFKKDIKKIKQAALKQKVKAIILSIEEAHSLHEVGSCRKLSGHKTAYRIRVGDYRMGLYIEGTTVVLVRFLNRKDIYKLFP